MSEYARQERELADFESREREANRRAAERRAAGRREYDYGAPGVSEREVEGGER